MNGPQRTACLAKRYNNGNYKWIELLAICKNFCQNAMEIEAHSFTEPQNPGSRDGQTICNSYWLHACKHEVADKTRKHGTTDGQTICNS